VETFTAAEMFVPSPSGNFMIFFFNAATFMSFHALRGWMTAALRPKATRPKESSGRSCLRKIESMMTMAMMTTTKLEMSDDGYGVIERHQTKGIFWTELPEKK